MRATLSQISSQVNRAAQSAGFEHANSHLSRSPIVLDTRGWNELATKFDRLLEDCERIAAASAKRLASANHAEERQGIAVLMLFEGAPQDESKPATNGRSKRTPRRAGARR